MSSQTTDTPGTTTTSAVDRSGATSQTYPNPGAKANQRFRDPQLHKREPHPTPARKQAHHFQAVQKGVGRNLSASAAATRITLHAPRTPHKSTPTPHPTPPKTPPPHGNPPPHTPPAGQNEDTDLLCGASPRQTAHSCPPAHALERPLNVHEELQSDVGQGRGSLRSNFPNLPEPGSQSKSAFPRLTTPPAGTPP